MNVKTVIEIECKNDIPKAINQVLSLAERAGLDKTRAYMVATSVSELATNIYRFAEKGQVAMGLIDKGTRRGIEIIAEDRGPGITDLAAAMEDGYSTLPESLGLGLPGVKRLMDEFEIETQPGIGTKVTIIKWMEWP